MASSIEIDCPPLRPRPDAYLPKILEGTGLEISDFNLVSKVFGCWSYEIAPDKELLYQSKIELISERIKSLYHSGQIRYGSW